MNLNLLTGIKLVFLGIAGYFGYTFLKKTEITDKVSAGVKAGTDAIENIAFSAGKLIEATFNKDAGFIDSPRANISITEIYANCSKVFGMPKLTEQEYRTVFFALESHSFNMINFKRSFFDPLPEQRAIELMSFNYKNFPLYKIKYIKQYYTTMPF